MKRRGNKIKYAQNILIVFLAAFLSCLTPVSTYALNDYLLNKYAQNNILFYDPDAMDCLDPSVSTVGNSDGSDVYVIGDSITVNSQDEIKKALPKVTINAQVDYSFDNSSGISKVSSIGDQGILVFALGTNGGVDSGDVQNLFSALSGKNIKIILTTIYNSDSSISAQMKDSNDAIKDATKTSNVSIMDWATAVSADPSKYIASNHVDPTEDGKKLFAKIMKDAVNKVTSMRRDLSETGYYINTSNYSGSNYSHWTGNCTNANSWDSFLSSQATAIRNAALSNGVPWEAMAAQIILESGGTKNEVCPYNPLGLKGTPSCDGRHRTFSSYEEAYEYYFKSIIPIRKAAGMFPSSPYSFIEYIEYGSGAPYAQCSKQEYINNNTYGCSGHKLGDPTPIYVGSVSSIICGIQKWAIEHNIPISSETFENFNSSYITNRTDGSVPSGAISNSLSLCFGGVDSQVAEAGLTYEQAKQFMISYGANKNNSSSKATGAGLWNKCNGGGSNCVTFSAFFVKKFTDIKPSSFGDGKQVVNTLAGLGIRTGTEPKVWSVFSWDAGSYGHTGVVLGYENGEWIVGHASCSREKRGAGNGTKSGDGSGFVIKSSSIVQAVWGVSNGLKFAYFDDKVDTAAISEYLRTGE